MRRALRRLLLAALLVAALPALALALYDFTRFQPYRGAIDALYDNAAPEERAPPETVAAPLRDSIEDDGCARLARLLLRTLDPPQGHWVSRRLRRQLWAQLICVHLPPAQRVGLQASLMFDRRDPPGLAAAAQAFYKKPLAALDADEATALIALDGAPGALVNTPEARAARHLDLVVAAKADAVRVSKSEGRLYLMSKGEPFLSFPVALGPEPEGHKQREGDGRTPEGSYVLDYKNPDSKYHRSIHVSYPNAQDSADAQARGEPPGGDIMIHGQPNGFRWAQGLTQRFDWTAGCIALRDEDMDAVWNAVDEGTPIEILP